MTEPVEVRTPRYQSTRKNVADNIPAYVLKQIARKSKMPKHEHRSIGVEILDGIRQLKRGDIDRVQHFPSVTAAREQVGLSQSEFARLLGVSVRTLQEWEQGRRIPSGPARTLLTIAYQEPEGPPGGRGLTSRSSRRR